MCARNCGEHLKVCCNLRRDTAKLCLNFSVDVMVYARFMFCSYVLYFLYLLLLLFATVQYLCHKTLIHKPSFKLLILPIGWVC